VDPAEFAAEYGLTEPAPTVVIVSRLARSMKQESVERTIDAVAALDGQVPGIRAVVVGGGTAEEDIRARAAKINAEAGRRLIVLTGALTDPRPAYAFADVVAGMGSSVLRGMAYGKPAVVVGERGFSREVTPGTLHVFDHNGFHGVGTGVPEPDPLPGQLLPFLRDEGLRRQTGDWAYRLIQDRFALRTLAGSLVGWYEDARGMKAGTLEAVGVTGRLVAYKSGQAGLGERARRLVRR
jgi:glycosyltransferase involved in cell wall biosynthesis